jgi:hypothetical protein
VLDRYSPFRILILLAIVLFCLFALMFYFLDILTICYANIAAALVLTWGYRFLPKPKLLEYEVSENHLRIIDSSETSKVSEITSSMPVEQILNEQGLKFPIDVTLELENIPNKIFLNKIHAHLESKKADKTDYFNLIFKDGKFQLTIATSPKNSAEVIWTFLTTIERNPQISKQDSI